MLTKYQDFKKRKVGKKIHDKNMLLLQKKKTKKVEKDKKRREEILRGWKEARSCGKAKEGCC